MVCEKMLFLFLLGTFVTVLFCHFPFLGGVPSGPRGVWTGGRPFSATGQAKKSAKKGGNDPALPPDTLAKPHMKMFEDWCL